MMAFEDMNVMNRAANLAMYELLGDVDLINEELKIYQAVTAKEMVEENGGKLLSGVSANLNYLVVGEDAGSKLAKAKKIPSIQILSEDEFLKMIE